MLRNPWTNKNIKFFYYLNGTFLDTKKQLGLQSLLESQLKKIRDVDLEVLKYRLDKYHKIKLPFAIDDSALPIHQLSLPKKNRAYYFDLISNTNYFSQDYRVLHKFGDVRKVPDKPALVKSRPLGQNNSNSILLKFNRVRHFTFVKDRIKFSNKKAMLIGRSNIKQEHRRQFLRMYFNHPMCDLGQINSGTLHDQWLKPKISINEHLRYKFILAQEGFDVASNLKWIMSSSSLAVMPKPKFETWFMEGELVPNKHYVCSNGVVPEFQTVDAQINLTIPSLKSTLKVGGTNLLGEEYFTAFGTGLIGSMYYVGLTINN